MIPKECKRLAEVDFPIAEVSKHAAREKSIRHGHPSTLHLWWARRPLASSRAVLLALLWPDPCDPACPSAFKEQARKLLPQVLGKPGPHDLDLRSALLQFIADFANWDVAHHPTYLEISRALVRAAYEPGDGGTYEPPLVVDPFSGGGSIPLEALRVGCDAFASDLNPIACLILKVMLEDITRRGDALAEDLRCVGRTIQSEAQVALSTLYPADPDGAKPIAYIWARTVRCEAPNCGAEIPLVRSFWLCKKASRRRALRYKVVRAHGHPPSLEFEVFAPMSEGEVPPGTVAHAKATCTCCGISLHPDRVRAQLSSQRGGADVVFDNHGHRKGGALLLATVLLSDSAPGRQYRTARPWDYAATRLAQDAVAEQTALHAAAPDGSLSPFPDEPIRRVPFPFGVINVWVYGMLCWGDMFTARQKLALAHLARAASKTKQPELRRLVALAVSKLADLSNALCSWEPSAECPRHMFGQQAIAMAWDFGEGVITSSSSGSFDVCLGNTAKAIESVGVHGRSCVPQQADAATPPLPDHSASVWFTDPPYYDAVPYSYLSDFFYVWAKRAVPEFAQANAGPLTDKVNEIVAYQDEGAAPASAYRRYEERIAAAFRGGCRVLHPAGVGSVVFAHKTTEGWEALLSGLIAGGWVITASWPIATEMASRLRARDSAALATSIHLVCRPRPNDAETGDWSRVLRELPKRVADWMERLQGEGVRGADLVFACIGPALEIFSRYRKVETAEGIEIGLATYLEKVWEVVGRTALENVLGTAEARAETGASGALEEDARLTALFLWTLQATEATEAVPRRRDSAATSTATNPAEDPDEEEDSASASVRSAKGFTLVFDVVRRFAQPLGIGLAKWEGRIVDTKKGVVRLIPIEERAKSLFGGDGAQAVATHLEQNVVMGPNPLQGLLFPDVDSDLVTRNRRRGRGRRITVGVREESLATSREATTLDRVHAAMLLQSAGRTNALRALLRAEVERSPDFERLANALTALYPKGSEEKRLLDAMLLAVPK